MIAESISNLSGATIRLFRQRVLLLFHIISGPSLVPKAMFKYF